MPVVVDFGSSSADDDLIRPPPSKKSRLAPVASLAELGFVDESITPLPPAAKKAREKLEKQEKQEKKKPEKTTEKDAPLAAGALHKMEQMTVRPTQQTGRYQFRFCLVHSGSFRRLTDTILNLAPTSLTLEIVGAKTVDDFQGIRIMTMMNAGTCYVSGALTLSVEDMLPTHGQSCYVTVNLSEFCNTIKAISTTQVTHIFQRTGEDRIRIEARDSSGKILHVSLPILPNPDLDDRVLDESIFKFKLEFPLADLDRIARHIALLKATHLTIAFLEHERTQDLLIQVAAEGQGAEYSEYFPTLKGGGIDRMIRVTQTVAARFDGDEVQADSSLHDNVTFLEYKGYKTLMRDTYNLKLIVNFIKSLDKSILSMHFAPAQLVGLRYTFAGTIAEKDFLHCFVSAIVAPDGDDSAAPAPAPAKESPTE